MNKIFSDLDHDENFGDHISPRLYGVWQMSSDWILKGGVSGGFRSPTLREITSDWGQTSRGGNIYGNPDLKPETSISKEISLNYNGANQLNASFTIFHNDFKDKITRACKFCKLFLQLPDSTLQHHANRLNAAIHSRYCSRRLTIRFEIFSRQNPAVGDE